MSDWPPEVTERVAEAIEMSFRFAGCTECVDCAEVAKLALDAIADDVVLVSDVERLIAEGPFRAGIDNDFCAVCGELLGWGGGHAPDCAYVALRDRLKVGRDWTPP